MSINGIDSNHLYEKLSRNENNKSAGMDAGTDFAKQLGNRVDSESAEGAYKTKPASYALPLTRAITRVASRSLSNKDSDLVKVNAVDGYTLKAKVDKETNVVYVEQKNEDGTFDAYKVDIAKINENSGGDNPIEQIALEALQKAEDKASGKDGDSMEDVNMLLAAAKFAEAAGKYGDMVQDRIKNGDTKYQIGSSAISLKEWDKIIANLDKTVDTIKEEQKERFEKQEEQLIKQKESLKYQDKEAEKNRKSRKVKDESVMVETPEVTVEMLEALLEDKSEQE